MRNYHSWDEEPEEEDKSEPFFNADSIRDEKLTETPEKPCS